MSGWWLIAFLDLLGGAEVLVRVVASLPVSRSAAYQVSANLCRNADWPAGRGGIASRRFAVELDQTIQR
nr:hypothetical protein [Kibdelosporangium sp. MJ126-NF4]CTQ97026.1 hypothetical protein [Kibdelosporangium sp. MJ126-NF4]